MSFDEKHYFSKKCLDSNIALKFDDHKKRIRALMLRFRY